VKIGKLELSREDLEIQTRKKWEVTNDPEKNFSCLSLYACGHVFIDPQLRMYGQKA
jgi:hypothetical protein